MCVPKDERMLNVNFHESWCAMSHSSISKFLILYLWLIQIAEVPL